MQRLLALVEQLDREKPEPVQVEQWFLDEINLHGEVRSEREFLDSVKSQIRL